ncbi:hypothetical protein KKG05_02930 [bacterium]|nr:hypothetical protein [bacterium]
MESFLKILLSFVPYIIALFPGKWLVIWFLRLIPLPMEQRKLVEEHLLLSDWIGVFERWIAIYLIMNGRLEGVAFIIAAKGLLRMPQIRSSENSKDVSYLFSSYILLGTLASIMFAIIIAQGWLFAEGFIFPE